jgi:hypothetical protein
VSSRSLPPYMPIARLPAALTQDSRLFYRAPWVARGQYLHYLSVLCLWDYKTGPMRPTASVHGNFCPWELRCIGTPVPDRWCLPIYMCRDTHLCYIIKAGKCTAMRKNWAEEKVMSTGTCFGEVIMHLSCHTMHCMEFHSVFVWLFLYGGGHGQVGGARRICDSKN